MYKNHLKFLIEWFIALALFLVVWPLILGVAILLWVFQHGQVFFSQVRPGKDMKPFNVYKFKTMNDASDADGRLLPDAERLTTVGKWVRKLSLDERPQLLNVLKGDMALIGPRPWLMEYLPLYNNFQKRRHEVRPGITGWAQVNGRNLLSWEDRFTYDVYYVDHVSFGLDAKIFFLTIWNIITSKGISSEGTATMHKFEGNNG